LQLIPELEQSLSRPADIHGIRANPEETYNNYLQQQQQRQHQHATAMPMTTACPITAKHGTPITLPFTFICTPHSQCTHEQQEMMTHVITKMDALVESLTFMRIFKEAL
jgi:hypothetical protein